MKYRSGHEALLGLFHYAITYRSAGQARTVEMLVKSKTHYKKLVARLADVLVKGGIEVADVAGLLGRTELHNTHMKEIQVFRMQKSVPAFTHVLPVFYGTYVDDDRQQYLVLEEFLTDAYVMRDYRDIAFWTRDAIEACVRDFSVMHSAYYGRYDALVAQRWLGPTLNAATMDALAPLWSAYADKLRHYVGTLFDEQYLAEHRRRIATIPDWWGRIDALKKTLIYNDAQIRNLAVRAPGKAPQLVLFDWECTSIQLPQRDLIEFLSYSISDRIGDAELAALLETARAELAQHSGQPIAHREWLEGCRYAVWDFHVNRMACQLVLHITLNRPDIERVFHASMRILACVERELLTRT
jgi:hypothetical protein